MKLRIYVKAQALLGLLAGVGDSNKPLGWGMHDDVKHSVFLGTVAGKPRYSSNNQGVALNIKPKQGETGGVNCRIYVKQQELFALLEGKGDLKKPVGWAYINDKDHVVWLATTDDGDIIFSSNGDGVALNVRLSNNQRSEEKKQA